MGDQIYVEVSGTVAIISGRRGEVTAFHYSPVDHSVDGAFIGWDNGGTAYVTTGHALGNRNQYREVDEIRDIDRNEFDALSGLASIRGQLGWRA